MKRRRTSPVFAAVTTALAGVGPSLGVSLDIQNPVRTSAYHAGDAVPVQWVYEGVGETFAIHLLKAGLQVADLCEAEEGGVCFDLTQDQTVLLPDSGLESGSDYTIRVTDQSETTLEDTSEEFTIIGTADANLEVTSPDGLTSLNAGSAVQVSWLYVGENEEFDIYLRQDGQRVSENLCASETSGSCESTTPVGSATVILPSEIADGANYRLLVVDKVDDDAWGLSADLPVGVELASTTNTDSEGTAEAKLGLVIGLCAGGVCLLAMLLVCLRKRSKEKRREEKLATLDMLNKRRPAPSVSLAVEGMAEPESPESPHQSSFINPIHSTTQNGYAQYEGQITPPDGDSTMWRRSRDLGRYVGRTISKSFSRSQSNMHD